MFSHHHTDSDDFDNTTVTEVYMADEGTNTQTDLQVSIPLTDDSIDEADNEIFLVKLEVASAVNRDLIAVEPASSKCIIIDNDCE